MLRQPRDRELAVFPFERNVADGNADDFVLGNSQQIASDPFFSAHPNVICGEPHAVDRIAAVDANMHLRGKEGDRL
jgi:hypothetical protein